jgi:hypothetical protein
MLKQRCRAGLRSRLAHLEALITHAHDVLNALIVLNVLDVSALARPRSSNNTLKVSTVGAPEIVDNQISEIF